MDLANGFLALTLHGAGWVLWLLVALSVVSLAIILERAWYFKTHKLECPALMQDIRELLEKAGGDDRRTVGDDLFRTRLCAAIDGAKSRERLRLERRLAFLATLGSNGPFIGLFGTVLGIIKAFHDLSHSMGG